MTKDNYPQIEPIKLKTFQSKQSKYNIAPRAPFRSCIDGPSGSGKTVLLVNMILDIYRDVFSRIYVFSPSVMADSSWLPVKKYVQHDLKINLEKEPCFFEEYHQEDLEKIVETQKKIIEHMKKQDYNKLYNILIVIDDHADNPTLSRNSKLLHSLYTRGRHHMISTITSVQSFVSLAPLIRKNITELYVYRLRNYKDLECILDELSALLDKKTLLEMYNLATSKPHSFWYINLVAKNVNEMFHINFEQKMLIE